MEEALGSLGEMVFRLVFRAIFESIFYGLKRVWYLITRQDDKARESLARHRIEQQARRKNIERIRRRKRKRA